MEYSAVCDFGAHLSNEHHFHKNSVITLKFGVDVQKGLICHQAFKFLNLVEYFGSYLTLKCHDKFGFALGI